MKTKLLTICLLLITSQVFSEGVWFPTNKPNCSVWNPMPESGETVIWSGACVSGKAHGRGYETWRFIKDGKVALRLLEVELKNGRIVGDVKITYEDGSIYIGRLKNGDRHGNGIYIYPEGGKLIGEWENGEFLGK
jgi:hypothetical protein